MPELELPSLMERRTFLRLMAGVAGAGAGRMLAPAFSDLMRYHYSSEWGTWFDGEKKLSFDEEAQIARHLDGIYDRLPPLARQVREGDAEAWTPEIVPFYESNKIVAKARFPERIFFERLRGRAFLFAYGRSDCEKYVWLNERFSREVSYWSWEYAQFLLSLTHEIGHVQQGLAMCNDVFRQEEVEGSAQAAAIEVAASMAREGGRGARPMFYAVITGLREMAFASAWKTAIEEELPQKIEKLAQQIYHDPWEMMSFRFAWETVGTSAVPFGFSAYGQWPLQKIVASLEWPDKMATEMAFPTADSKRPDDSGPFDDSFGRIYAPFEAKFPLNDTAWVLGHMEELVGAI